MAPSHMFVVLLYTLAYMYGTQGRRRDIEELERTVRDLESTLGVVSRQLMMQQFYVEEQTRANGNSGIKRVRNYEQGTRSYYSASHVSDKFASIHNHANNQRTIGMGEFVAVLNGIEFRTRHNDYRLMMKSTTSTEYGATEEIPFPAVPPEVSQNLDIEDQAAEMKEWFRAWANQDHSERDYRQYFKPVLCYLEGAWTNSDQSTIDESFESDRHHLDAHSWLDLQEKIRFTSYSGTKDGLENYAYLPTTVMSLINNTTPVLAQWNFQILCHPLSRDIALDRLIPIDDLKARMSLGLTFEEYVRSRAARFQLPLEDEPYSSDGSLRYTLLDELMTQIPGADNYLGNIEDNLFEDTAYPFDTNNNTPMNAAYFHRSYRVERAGAMGLKFRRRGFSDENMFLAQTTQRKVMGLPIENCDKEGQNCDKWFQRWTYAIPLEIIYLTPLSSWNPYSLVYKGESNKKSGKAIYSGPGGPKSRDGSETPDKCFNGTNSKVYYMTPLEFFESETDFDPADTTQDYTCVLDPGQNMRLVKASGYRIHLPNIPGVGSLRQRYPIMPVHGEGSGVWKELDALKDLILYPNKFGFMFENNEEEEEQAEVLELHFVTEPADANHEFHVHHFSLTADQSRRYLTGENIDVITETANGHEHSLQIARVDRNGKLFDVAKRCDGIVRCWDGHGKMLTEKLD